jgi:tetratricopeptide (TPR) repeat protein
VRESEHAQPDALERLARHAATLGERGEAAGAYLTLGDLARTNHKDTEADRYYALALQHAPEEDLRCRACAWLGRGRSRYRVARVKEALEDFQAARTLAEALADPQIRAEILLEEATALDWNREFEASARRVDEAKPIVQSLGADSLASRLAVAEGRTLFRQGRSPESIALLEKAVTQATALNDYEARVIGLLLLSSQFAIVGRLEEAEPRFQEVITIAAEANDGLHLCSAYSNRVILWMGRREPDQATDDLHRAIKLARETGNPWLERMASYNVANLLHWNDQRTDALALARRARLLEQRFVDRPVAFCSLLLACILIGLEQFNEAAQIFTWIALSCPPDGSAPDEPLYVYQMIQLVLLELAPGSVAPDHRGSWDEVLATARLDPQTEVFVEVLYWRARCALQTGDAGAAGKALAEARTRRSDCPIWPASFECLERQLTALQPAAGSG